MDYSNDTPSSPKNKHLNDYERGKIELLHAQGLSPYAIWKANRICFCHPDNDFWKLIIYDELLLGNHFTECCEYF